MDYSELKYDMEEFESDQDKKLPQPPLVKAAMRKDSIELPKNFDALSVHSNFLDIINTRHSSRVYTQESMSLLEPGNVQRSGVGSSALLLQKKSSVCRTQQTIRTRNHVEFIHRLLLTGVMNEQQANAVFIGKCFQFSDNFIITGIAVCISTGFADFLQRVDDNEPGIRVFLYKPFELFFQTDT